MRGGSLGEPLAPSRAKLISHAAVSAHEKAGRIRPAHSEENKNRKIKTHHSVNEKTIISAQ
jgi:hypothetical protein